MIGCGSGQCKQMVRLRFAFSLNRRNSGSGIVWWRVSVSYLDRKQLAAVPFSFRLGFLSCLLPCARLGILAAAQVRDGLVRGELCGCTCFFVVVCR